MVPVLYLKKDLLSPDTDKKTRVKVKVVLFNLTILYRDPDPQPHDSIKSTARCPDPLPGKTNLAIVLVTKFICDFKVQRKLILVPVPS
jgi:hypothetical protein